MIMIAATTCDNGLCPSFHKPPGGGVVVQGYKTNDPGHTPIGMPDHEDAVFIPDGDWDQLIFELLRYYRQEQPVLLEELLRRIENSCR